jgi:hypothetical protein
MADLLTGSFLDRLILGLRKYVDEPSVNVKYSDNDLIAKLAESWAELWVDANNNSNSPIIVRQDITLVVDQQDYILPPHVGKIVEWAKIEDSSGLTEWEIDTRGYWNPAGFGFRVEGNVIRLGSKPKEGHVLRLGFVPNGDISPIVGSFADNAPLAATSTTFTLNAATDKGMLDTRPNCYAGYTLRTFPTTAMTPDAAKGESITQERLISAYNPITRVATVAAAFDPIFSTPNTLEPLTYEIVPMHLKMVESALMIRASQNILSMEGYEERYNLQMKEYQRKMRSLRMALATILGRRANKFHGDLRENNRYARFPGIAF